jgi:hypothetical protein
MASKRVEDYAHAHGLSNRQAKRRMGGRRKDTLIEQIARGQAVAGTGKGGKAKKGKKG